jgi:hypothetical protein
MMPLVGVRVRDALVAGEGSMQAWLLSLVPVLNERGGAELSEAALQRYLAESVWFPTALLPTAGVEWWQIGENRARATLTVAGTTASLDFRFNDEGEIAFVYTRNRYREVDGAYEPTPWSGYFSNYQERSGMRIPTEAYVQWHLPTGLLPYWRGEIVEVAYDFAR